MQVPKSSRAVTLSLAAVLLCLSLPAAAQNCAQLVADWPHGPADAVYTAHGTSYFGSGTVLMIGDVSDISDPQIEGFLDLGMLIGDIVADGNTVIVAAGSFDGGPGAVITVDVSVPSAPVVLEVWQTPLPARSIAVAAGVVYAGLVDPLDPAAGRLLAIEPVPFPSTPPRVTSLPIAGWPERLDVANERLWIAELGTGFRGFDLADPTAPVELVHLAGDVRDLEAAGDLLYVAQWRDDDPDVLEIFDVSAPDQPVSLSEYRADRVRKVRVVGPIAYLASAPVESSIRLELVDVSDPAEPEREDVLTLGSNRRRRVPA